MVFVAALAVILFYALTLVSSVFGTPVDISSMFAMLGGISGFVLLLIPALILVFPSGYYAPGSERRLVLRTASGLYLMAVLLVFTRVVSYAVSNAMIYDPGRIAIDSADITLDITMISMILAAIPAVSIVDAFLEFYEKR